MYDEHFGTRAIWNTMKIWKFCTNSHSSAFRLQFSPKLLWNGEHFRIANAHMIWQFVFRICMMLCIVIHHHRWLYHWRPYKICVQCARSMFNIRLEMTFIVRFSSFAKLNAKLGFFMLKTLVFAIPFIYQKRCWLNDFSFWNS